MNLARSIPEESPKETGPAASLALLPGDPECLLPTGSVMGRPTFFLMPPQFCMSKPRGCSLTFEGKMVQGTNCQEVSLWVFQWTPAHGEIQLIGPPRSQSDGGCMRTVSGLPSSRPRRRQWPGRGGQLRGAGPWGSVCAVHLADAGLHSLPTASGGTFAGRGNRLCQAAQRTGPRGQAGSCGGTPTPEGATAGSSGMGPEARSHRVHPVSICVVCPSTGVPMLSVQPKGKQKGCAGCNRKIKDRYLLKALDKYWHEDCLKCACCDCRLGEVGSTLYTKANLILCRRDYLRCASRRPPSWAGTALPLPLDPGPGTHPWLSWPGPAPPDVAEPRRQSHAVSCSAQCPAQGLIRPLQPLGT